MFHVVAQRLPEFVSTAIPDPPASGAGSVSGVSDVEAHEALAEHEVEVATGGAAARRRCSPVGDTARGGESLEDRLWVGGEFEGGLEVVVLSGDGVGHERR